jgi:hypothetical protein
VNSNPVGSSSASSMVHKSKSKYPCQKSLTTPLCVLIWWHCCFQNGALKEAWIRRQQDGAVTRQRARDTSRSLVTASRRWKIITFRATSTGAFITVGIMDKVLVRAHYNSPCPKDAMRAFYLSSTDNFAVSGWPVETCPDHSEYVAGFSFETCFHER